MAEDSLKLAVSPAKEPEDQIELGGYIFQLNKNSNDNIIISPSKNSSKSILNGGQEYEFKGLTIVSDPAGGYVINNDTGKIYK